MDRMSGPNGQQSQTGPIILYDGVCGLCNRLTRFVIKRDPHARFRFASLQSPFAAEVLARHGKDPRNLDTMYVVLDHGQPSERLLRKSRAGLFILAEIGGIWGVSRALALLPTPLLDLGYNLLARVRYRVFGKYETCPMPTAGTRQRFLDAG
jgi:predicted DCC family thiol-disulfide oxidoreductase YuxK